MFTRPKSMLPVQIGRKDDLPFALAVDFLLVLRRAMISHAQRFEAIGQHYRSSCLSNIRRSCPPVQGTLRKACAKLAMCDRSHGKSQRSLEQTVVSDMTASAKSFQCRTEKCSLEANTSRFPAWPENWIC